MSEGSVRLGVLEGSRRARTHAWLRCPHTPAADLFIPTRHCRNRALSGDTVAVRLLPRALWQVTGESVRPFKCIPMPTL